MNHTDLQRRVDAAAQAVTAARARLRESCEDLWSGRNPEGSGIERARTEYDAAQAQLDVISRELSAVRAERE